jgi:membrane associated rhomboid family serine protease
MFPLTPMVKKILIINAVIWLVEVILVNWVGLGAPVHLLALKPSAVFPGLLLWQVFTYMWLHSPVDPMHIVFNSLFLWLFGGYLESSWGAKPFLRFYIYCGVGAGIVVFLSGLIIAPDIPVLGASGAIYGLVVSWAILYPNRLIYIWGVFPIKAKYLVILPIGYAVLEFLVRAQGVSHSAHLGGMAVGALLVTGYWRPRKVAKRFRYWWLKRKLKVIEDENRRNRPPDGGYWH